jgi:small subunit ribosomal protein S17
MHGGLKTRGAVKEGVVKNAKSKKTIVVEIPMLRRVAKYERFEKRRSKIHAHVPECLLGKVLVGSKVRIDECRKLSKTKAFVVTKVLE